MGSCNRKFSQIIFNKVIIQTLICILFTGIVVDAMIEDELLRMRLMFRKMCAISNKVSYLVVLVAHEILKIVFDLFLDTLEAIFRYYFEIEADDLFLTNLLNLKCKLVSAKTPDKHVAGYTIRRNALINLYIYAICIAPRFLLHLLIILYRIYSYRDDRTDAAILFILVVLLLFYMCCFFVSSMLRKNIRSEYNKALVKKVHYAGRTFGNIDVVKAYCTEDAEAFRYLKLLKSYFYCEYVYHLVSEAFRFVMRVIILVPQIAIVISIQYQLGHIRPDAAYRLFFWIKSINQSMLQLRNCLAMYFEYKHELRFQDALFVSEKQSEPIRGDMDGLNAPSLSNRGYLGTDLHSACFSLFVTNIYVENISFYLDQHKLEHALNDNLGGLKGEVRLANEETAVKLQASPLGPSKQPVLHGYQDTDGFIQVSCEYLPIVKFPSFTICSRRTNGISGEDINNKDMIFEALLGIRDYAGTIRFGTADATVVSQDMKFSAISYLPCQQELFNKSVLFNLSYGTGKSREQIIRQLGEMGLWPFFRDLHSGLDTEVGKKDVELSSGQRQMICVCITLLKECPVYLLNHPTIFLDETHKKKIFELILKIRNRTVVVITPEKDLLPRFDNIINI